MPNSISKLPVKWVTSIKTLKLKEIKRVLDTFVVTKMDMIQILFNIRTLLAIFDNMRGKVNKAYIAEVIFNIIKDNMWFTFVYERFGLMVISKIHEFKEIGKNCFCNKNMYDKYNYLVPLIKKGIQKRKNSVCGQVTYGLNVGVRDITRV